MNYKELIFTINKKKQNYEDYYKDLLLLENELRNCESIVKAQVHYFLGVDFLFYQDTQKALEHHYSALELLINLVYTTRDIEIIHSTIQKVIIEISKIKTKDVIKAFYEKINNDLYKKKSKENNNLDTKNSSIKDNKLIINEHKNQTMTINENSIRLKKLIRNFQNVQRVFTEYNEIFIFLLKEEPKASLDFLTSDHQIDLLIEKMKTEFDFEIIKFLRHKQKTNKQLVFLLIHDEEYFEEYLTQFKALIIRNNYSNIFIELITSCLSTGKINILKQIFLKISSLLSEEDKRISQILMTDIYKVFSDGLIGNSLIDLEQVVHYWFITKQYSKILKIGDKVSKKVLFIALSRENDTNSFIKNNSLSSSDDDLDKIGANWDVESDYILEKVRCCLRNVSNEKINYEEINYEKIKSIIRKVKDVDLLINILRLIKNCESTFDKQEGVGISSNKNEDIDVVPHLRPLFKDILLECLSRKNLLFQGLKVFISFLHLKHLDFEVSDRLQVLNGLKYEGLSEADKLWLYKVVYNNLVDVYEGDFEINVDESINLLISLSSTSDSFIISILLISKSRLNDLFLAYSASNYSPLASALFYGAFIQVDPPKAKAILKELNLSEVDDQSLLYLLGLEEVDGKIVIEGHYRKILKSIHLEGIIMRLGLKGTVFLYEYLRSIIVIDIQKYLTEGSKVILKTNLQIVEHLKCSEMILFFQNILS